MKIIYLIGPYRGESTEERDANILKARKAAIALWRKGYAVICPHLNTQRFDDLLDIPEERFLLGDIQFLLALWPNVSCALLPGWEASSGSGLEQHVAVLIGLEIKPLQEYLDEDTGK